MSKTRNKTVQEYIDETPQWADGTGLADTPMTGMQWRIWWLATAGKFFEGMVVFMTGVALPLITMEFGLTAAQTGMTGAAVQIATAAKKNAATEERTTWRADWMDMVEAPVARAANRSPPMHKALQTACQIRK